MNTSLLTFDGFPRTDIDVAQIRTTRARIIHLKNDYAGLMEIVEKKMHEHFAKIKEEEAKNGPSTTTTTSKPTETETETEPVQSAQTQAQTQTQPPAASTATAITALPDDVLTPPFAFVKSVTPNSPAATAGLLADDKICVFGDVNWMNHDKLRRLGEVVLANKDRPVQVVVRRGSDNVTLELVPRENRGGPGMLGCHIKPLST
ncbi:GTP-binding nuclear protein gsp1/Ran [Ascosphaera pollenicola]|nr:GTP-binding nuclear protein gsp1/Ran [Ascosphaera pollenicola]